MQMQLSFLQTSSADGSVPVWASLDERQRTELVSTLGRLIAQTILASRQAIVGDDEEPHDE